MSQGICSKFGLHPLLWIPELSKAMVSTFIVLFCFGLVFSGEIPRKQECNIKMNLPISAWVVGGETETTNSKSEWVTWSSRFTNRVKWNLIKKKQTNIMASLHGVNQPSTKERRENEHFAGKEERVRGGEGRSAAIPPPKVEGQWPQQRLWGKLILLSTCIYMFLVIKEYTCTMTINSSIARPKPTWAWTKVSVLAWIYNTHIVEWGNKISF